MSSADTPWYVYQRASRYNNWTRKLKWPNPKFAKFIIVYDRQLWFEPENSLKLAKRCRSFTNDTAIIHLTFCVSLFGAMIASSPLSSLLIRAGLREGGGPQVGEVTCGGLPHLTCKRDHIKMIDCMDRRVTPPKRVTSPTYVGSPTSM